MSKLKALILGFLILVPLFVFIFIYTFGEHHFTLKSYFPVVDASGQVVTEANGDTLFRKVPAFEFTDQQGAAFTQKELQDKLYVVNFFFTSCPGLCRKMSTQLVRVHETYQNNPTVELLSISVKPEEDTPEVLNAYAQNYKADTSQWHFLTGNKERIYNLAQHGFDLGTIESGGTDGIIHSEKLMLVDRNHVVRGIYDGTDVKDVDRLILEIRVLLDEYSKGK